MAYKLQLKRGSSGSLPTGSAGEPLFTTDTNDLYIGTGAANQKFQKYIASGTSSQFLKGDGSLDSGTYQAQLNGTGFVKISGTTISYDNNTYYLASNPSAFIALTALTASSPLSYNNTTGAFTISQASGSTNGYLSSTDWTTFNNKQNALTNPVTGTGTTGQVAYFNGTSSITSESNLFWDATNDRLGIGTSSPTSILHISKSSSKFRITDTGITDANYNTFTLQASDQNQFSFGVGSTTSNPYALTVFGSTQNISIGGLSDNGNRLQVTGNGYFSGNVGVGTSSPAGKLTVADSVNNGTANVLYLSNTSQTGVTSAAINFINIDGAIKSSIIGAVYGNDYMTFNVGSNTERMRISASGNLGLGVVPSAWSNTGNLDINSVYLSLSSQGTYGGVISNNAYYDGIWKYKVANYANQYQTLAGEHRWLNAGVGGAAGNTISFTQAMTLTAAGRLLLGTTTEGTDLLQVNGSAIFSNDIKFSVGASLKWGSNTYIYGDNNIKIEAVVNGNTALTLASTGAATFSSSVTATSTLSARTGFTSAGTAGTPYFDEAIIIGQSANQCKIQYGNSFTNNNGTWLKFVVNSNTAANTPVDVMTLKYDGNVGIGTTSPSEKFVVSNGGSQNIEINPSFIQSFNRSSPGYAELPFYASKFSFNVGNLLVGTTTDSGERLVVSGSIKTTADIFLNYDYAIRFKNSTGTYRQILAYADDTYLDARDGGMILRTGTGGTATERVRIKSNGSVRYIPMATPASAEAGDVYYDSTSNKLRCYNGTSWNDLF